MVTQGHTTGARDWLGRANLTISDVALGCILLLAGTAPIWVAGRAPSQPWMDVPPNLFPALVGVALWATAVVLLARTVLFRRPPPLPYGLRHVAIVVAGVVVWMVFAWNWLPDLTLDFSPVDHAAFILLILISLVALARRSRLQAAGMMLFGVLLGTVGADPITGHLRLTMGFEELYPGLATPVIAAGLLLAADGIVCLASPSLWIATYGWIVPGWRSANPPVIVALLARIVAALAIVTACYAAIICTGQTWDIGFVLAFAVFGAACKLLSWNRLLVVIGCFYSDGLEQKLRQTLLITQGDLGLLWGKPLTAALWSAIAVVALMLVLTAIRNRQLRWKSGAPA